MLSVLFVIAAVTVTCWALEAIKRSPRTADRPVRRDPFWSADTTDPGD